MRKGVAESEVRRKQQNKIKKKEINKRKLIMEAIKAMISWHYNTIKMGNISKSELVEK